MENDEINFLSYILPHLDKLTLSISDDLYDVRKNIRNRVKQLQKEREENKWD